MTFSQALGERIRFFRKTAGLRLWQVAEQSGVSVSYLSTVERGQSSASLDAYRRIAGALGLTLSALIAWAEETSKAKERK